MSAVLRGLDDYSTSAIVSLSTAILISIAFLFVQFTRYSFGPNAPKLIGENLPIVGALRFFSARWDFFRHNREHSPTGNFSYFVGKYPLVGISGAEGRKLFFESRELGFSEGYSVLFGQAPNSLDKTKASVQKEWGDSGGYFSRRITKMLKTENFSHSLPHLISDSKMRLAQLADEPNGITNPFESLYRIVYHLTMRMVGANDIAENPELLEKSLLLYEDVEASATTAAVLFPWFPSWGIIKRTVAGGRLYVIFKNIVDHRLKTGIRGDDALQFLIDQGDSMQQIIEFVIGALFAGLLNSGINVAWVILHLTQEPEWREKVLAEIRAAGAKYGDPKASLVEQLSQVPVEGWENDFPLIDLCLRDSIRLQLLGTAFRRNIGDKDLPIGNTGEVIPSGAFVTYALADVHMNPEIYPDPEKWDPSRYLPENAQDKKAPHAYVGWGAARHPCLGMRFAKLEQNMITAFFLAMYESELVTKDGRPSSKLPDLDLNSHSAAKPKIPVYLKVRPRN